MTQGNRGVVGLRFFVACGDRRSRDRTRASTSIGKTMGLQRYPGKVPLQAPSTTRGHPYGICKTTTPTRLGQPPGTLRGALGLSPSQRGGLPACVVCSWLPLPSAACRPSQIALPREAQTPDALLSPPVGRALRPIQCSRTVALSTPTCLARSGRARPICAQP